MNNVATEIEAKALAIAADPKRLKQQLLENKGCLLQQYRDRFRKYRFDFASKRLYSGDGLLFLKWRLRPEPDKPVSYHNQQTQQGCVCCSRWGPKPQLRLSRL